MTAAAAQGPVLPVFILDEPTPSAWHPGAASRWWLHHALAALAGSIEGCGGGLLLQRGDPVAVLGQLVKTYRAAGVYCHRQVGAQARHQEQALKDALRSSGAELRCFAGELLFEPQQVRTGSDQPYQVFTPFWKRCLGEPQPRQPRPAARPQWFLAEGGEDLGSLGLLPRPDWAAGLRERWQPGEQGAARALERFIDQALDRYPDQRDRPDRFGTSRLSPHLHFGEVSPHQVWHRIGHAVAGEARSERGAGAYLRELGWREFCHHLLHHFPQLPEQPFRETSAGFPWRQDQPGLKAWQAGRTGFPIVDAGMRELWHTGWMHNRVRMIAGSFLVKDLLVNWQQGQRWFWDTLVDADLANNAAGWQWIAGSGADAAPYFRVFNPVLQGRKFDPGGQYVRRWVPELAELPDRFLHAPWEAPAAVLQAAGVELGNHYPVPIVDHARARDRALAAYRMIKA